MMLWALWLQMLADAMRPVEVEVRIFRPPSAKVIDFQAERAKRAARRA